MDPTYHLSGYVQSQYESSAASQDQLAQGGATLNQDQILVRRARLFVDHRWGERAAAALELDANTARGITVGLRRAEATLFYPTGQLTVGLTDIPFGFELVESSRLRPFMERSTASLAFFPGEPDVGARVGGQVSFFRYAVALLAGEPVSTTSSAPRRGDPNAAKDLVAHVGVDTAPAAWLTAAGGVSLLTGTGFHEGTDATKDRVEWRDLNENGAVDSGELTAIPGAAATPSANFDRWAVGADLRLGLHTPLGWSRVAAEVTVASNLDRGLFVADPVASGVDTRELGVYASLLQELGEYALVGLRFDRYDPNLDAFDSRAGNLVPNDASVTTFSPLVGAIVPAWHARLFLQYDFIADHLARDGRGVPTDLSNDRFTVRLQVEL